MGDVDKKPETDPERDYGVLLGWKAMPAGKQILLTLQSTRKTPESRDDVREFRYFISKEQAVLLGNNLYTLSGETAPTQRRPGILSRFFR